MKHKTQLVYFMSETHYFSKDQALLVVNIVGPLAKHNMVIFQECQDNISRTKAKWVILNFRDVPAAFDSEFLSLFDQLRGIIQKRAGFIRFSGVHPELRKVLVEKNLIQIDEISNNLAEALQSFPVTPL